MVYHDHMALHDDKAPELRETIAEFARRLQNVEAEMSELRERKKELVEEFRTRLDLKSFTLAMRVAKAKAAVVHEFEFETMLDVLETEFAVLP